MYYMEIITRLLCSQLAELELGKWFKKTGRRSDIFLATKFGVTWGRDKAITGDPEYVKEACEKSLKRLGVDQIDLYYMHR